MKEAVPDLKGKLMPWCWWGGLGSGEDWRPWKPQIRKQTVSRQGDQCCDDREPWVLAQRRGPEPGMGRENTSWWSLYNATQRRTFQREEAVHAETNGDKRFASSFISIESKDGDGAELVLRAGWKGRQELSWHIGAKFSTEAWRVFNLIRNRQLWWWAEIEEESWNSILLGTISLLPLISHGRCRLKITNVGEGVEKRETLCPVGGNENGAATMETVWRFIKKLKIELPYDLAIPLHSNSGVYLKKMKTLIWKDICTFIFIVVLFTITKIWR